MHWTKRMRFLYRAWRYRFRVEPAEIRFLRQQLHDGEVAVDVGAHKGAYTWWMQRAVGPRGRVFAFEPQPELAEYLAAATRALGLDHVTVVPAAVSRTCGTMTLSRPGPRPSPGATIEPRDEPRGDAFSVRAETLDAFFAAPPVAGSRPVRFVKCDAEGHELAVFQGAEGLLREDRPILLFECEARHHRGRSIEPVFDYLRGLSYEGYFFRGRERRPLSEFRPEDQAAPGRPGYVYDFAFLPLSPRTPPARP